MDYQHITILGRATAEPKQFQGKNSKEYATFSVAVNRYLGKERGHVTTYYDCLLFDKHAKEKTIEKIKKGALIAIQGRPEADGYVTKEGEPKAQLKIVVNSWRVLK
jgi:single-stranded DNA-binding protein